MTPKGDHIPKEDRGEGKRWKAPTPTRPKKRNPGWRSNTNPWEGRTAARTSTSRGLQRQPEAGEPHENEKQTQPKEGKPRHGRGLRKNTDGTWDRWPNRTRGTAAPWGQANKHLTKNHANTLHSEAKEGGQLRKNPNHLKPAANLEARGKNPRKGPENSRYQDQPTARVRVHELEAVTNHEGQPRPPTQPTNAWDTAGQKHTHPKVREGQQGDRTCKPSRHPRNWSTLTQGAKPQLPQQASGAGEAPKKKGRVEA